MRGRKRYVSATVGQDRTVIFIHILLKIIYINFILKFNGFESEAQEMLSDSGFQDGDINVVVGKMEEVSMGGV